MSFSRSLRRILNNQFLSGVSFALDAICVFGIALFIHYQLTFIEYTSYVPDTLLGSRKIRINKK